MMIKKTLAAVLATSLVGAPIVAQAATAQAARTGSPVDDSENIEGGWFLPVLALLAVILGIVVIVDSNNNDLPTSP